MKKYIKPNTEMYAVELQNLMNISGEEPQGEVSDQEQLGKENSWTSSSNSVWDEEE